MKTLLSSTAIAAAGLLGLLGGAAHAQTTTCLSSLPGMVTCETTPNPLSTLPARVSQPIDPANVPAKRCNPIERMAVGAAMCDARAAAADRADIAKSIGALAAEGRCEDARQAALRAGDFDLATRIVGLCTPIR